MSVRRKLVITMIALIVGMALIFALVTQLLLRDVLQVMTQAAKQDDIQPIAETLLHSYEANDHTWAGLRTGAPLGNLPDGASVIVQSQNLQPLLQMGPAETKTMQQFGIREPLLLNQQFIGMLIYHDANAEWISKLRIGVMSSTRALLFAGTAVVVPIAFIVVYWLSKKLTAPLRSLIPVLDRLGKGEYGIQAPVVSRDEYGQVAQAFNAMSIRLQRLEQLRRQMSADVAHELRTPLTIISGKLELMQQEAEPIAPEALLPLQDELIRLTRLVDDLHELSLGDAKKLPLKRKLIDLETLLQRILGHLQPMADSKHVRLTFIHQAAGSTLSADSNRLTQAFYNLLTNGIRYTPEGGEVTVRLMADGVRRLAVSVQDTGIGIAPEYLPFVFERFYRADEARTRSSGGMGLGLAIAKQVIEAHGGSIEVRSAPGEGATFTVSLPQEPVEQS